MFKYILLVNGCERARTIKQSTALQMAEKICGKNVTVYSVFDSDLIVILNGQKTIVIERIG